MDAWRAWAPAAAVLAPFAAAMLIPFASSRPNLREAITFTAAGALWLLVGWMLWELFRGRIAGGELFALAPGLSLAFRADAFGLMFAAVSSTLWIATSSYSIGYARALSMHAQTRFFAVFAVCLGAAAGIALAANLFTFVIFYEILTLATYPLVVHQGTRKAKVAGRIYLCYALTAGALLLGATAWLWQLTGDLSFRPGGLAPGALDVRTVTWLFVLLSIGFGVKAGVMPLHAWLPVAMIAPTPVSALLHAVAVVKAGVFGYLRLIHFILGPDAMREAGLWEPLAWVAAATILCSSIIALRQDELKRRLAYSTVSHLSYIILGAAMLVPAGQIGALLHLANHAMLKITLFFCAGAIYVAAHKDRVSQLDGLGWRMPVTFGAFAIGALGLAGVPGLCGFISKWWLARATIEAGAPWLMGVLLLSGILNIAYLLPIVTRGFSGPRRGPVLEAPMTMLVPIVVIAAASVVFGSVAPAIAAQTALGYRALEAAP
ncbi:MAG TPA: proton-conducting transporter membrane subunit [bacterium]